MLVLVHFLQILWVSNKLFLTFIRALILMQTSGERQGGLVWAIHRPQIRQRGCPSSEREFGALVEIYLSRLKAPCTPEQSGILWTSTQSWVTRARNSIWISAAWRKHLNLVWGVLNADTASFWQMPLVPLQRFGLFCSEPGLLSLLVRLGWCMEDNAEGWEWFVSGCAKELLFVSPALPQWGSE